MLKDFLASKPLYYKKIDYSRMPRAWESVREHFSLPTIIHVIGTNGKGSTGRFLAHYLYKNGKKTGHYSSPHISKFNERIWIDGDEVSNEKLELVHIKLQEILSDEFKESLSYFEYTTLLGMLAFEGCEYVVLEAGLGGEYDATSVFGSDLTLVTPISQDHEAFLGDSVKEIGTTKLNAIRKFAILGNQKEKIIYKISRELGRKKHLEIFRYDHFFGFDEKEEAKKLLETLGMASFFLENLLLAMSGAKFFGFTIEFSKLEDFTLHGRCEQIAENITIDVGHNEAAAKVLKEHFKDKKVVLIYNSYADKDYKSILFTLMPVIKRIEYLPILNERVEQKEILEKVISDLHISFSTFTNIEKDEQYLVFGSFLVVEEFLKRYGDTQT